MEMEQAIEHQRREQAVNIESPVNQGAKLVAYDMGNHTGYYPYEFSSPREESLAARETAWIGTYITMNEGMGGHIDIVGPDAVEFLNHAFVNRDFGKMKIGGSRHAIACDERGYIMNSCVIMRKSEDRFATSGMFFLETAGQSGYDVRAETIREFLFQVDGPKSLEILEEAAQTNLHDLKFAQNKSAQIAGCDAFVHRLGMSGALAYELHGDYEDYDAVYSALIAAGEKFGAKRQGIRNYCAINHTPGGYPNQHIHFSYSDGNGGLMPPFPMGGSAADDPANYLVTPYDLSWEYLIDWNHEFTGREALLALKDAPHRTAVTLEWNLEDLAALVVAEISGDFEAAEEVFDYNYCLPEFRRIFADKVMDGDKVVGITSGRTRDYYYKKFLSLAFVDTDVAVEGKELTVVWGDANGQQMPIRATVARFPYYNGEWRNETCDVNAMVPKRF